MAQSPRYWCCVTDDYDWKGDVEEEQWIKDGSKPQFRSARLPDMCKSQSEMCPAVIVRYMREPPPLPRTRKRKLKQIAKKPSRVEALERRLEELSSRLAAVDSSHGIAEPLVQVSSTAELSDLTSPNQISDEVEVNIDAALSDSHEMGDQGSMDDDAAQPEFYQTSDLNTQPSAAVQSKRNGLQDTTSATSRYDQEAIELLERYRTQISPLFPFVVVPTDLASLDHRRQRPFLWRAVKMAALWQEGARHARLGKRLLKDLTNAVLLRPYKDFDVVQGLLVFIAWYHWHLNEFQLNNLLGLLQSLCQSLDFGQNTRDLRNDRVENMSNDSLEQGRAYCGWYYLSSIVFNFHETPEACPQIRFFDHLCKILTHVSQRLTDQRVIALVKIEQLTQRILLSRISRETTRQIGGLLDVTVVGFQKQIDNLRDSLSPELRLGRFIQAHFHVMEMMLYKVAISDPSFQPFLDHDSTMDLRGQEILSDFLNVIETHQTSIKTRLDLLNGCLKSIKSFLTDRLSYVDIYLNLTYMASFDMAYCLELCERLIMLQGLPRWKLNAIRDYLALGVTLSEEHMEDLKRLAVETNMADTSPSSRDYNEDVNEDAELLPRPPESMSEPTKHPFERMVEHSKRISSLLKDEREKDEDAEVESCVEIGIATSKQMHQNLDVTQQRRRRAALDTNAMSDITGQGNRSDERQGIEAPLDVVEQASAPSAHARASRTTDPAVSLIDDRVSSAIPADPTDDVDFISSATFPQISLWPRLLR
ncbi:hypothetical protein BP5796_12231 [Coleophoma crateriformis]|uniref:Uncharacterized protein n=1 Tax=Coleophoma crateriformis TaxID=565419 RepID=A0A3D8Q914_9HELO|nr:hypothetical protein BP5796_12231 [Coleophoma crateriformis]